MVVQIEAEETPIEVMKTTQALDQAKKIVNPSEGPNIVEKQVPQDPTSPNIIEPVIKIEHPQKVYVTKKKIFRAYQLIWYIVTIIEILLTLRFFFKAVGASTFSSFATLIYIITFFLALPFQGILHNTVMGNSIFEWSTLVGMIIYLIISWAISYLFKFVNPVSPEEVEEKI